jgi:hypothetical protein
VLSNIYLSVYHNKLTWLQIPLNQEDMAATLAAFGVAPIFALERMGLPLTLDERECYLALWRHLGYYLGVSPRLLETHFIDWAHAEAFLSSAALHLFDPDPDPDIAARLPALPVLHAVAVHEAKNGEPPDLEYHVELARVLLGPELSRAVALPPTPKRSTARWRVRLALIALRVPVWFGSVYPRKGWEATRVECIRRALPRFLCRQLEGRRTTFLAVKAPAGTDRVSISTGDKEQRWEKVDLQGDAWRAEMREIERMWKSIWREMVGALMASGVFLAGAGVVLAWRGFKL